MIEARLIVDLNMFIVRDCHAVLEDYRVDNFRVLTDLLLKFIAAKDVARVWLQHVE